MGKNAMTIFVVKGQRFENVHQVFERAANRVAARSEGKRGLNLIF